MSLSGVASVLRRWIVLVAAGTLLAAASSYLLSRTITPLYRATVILMVAQPGDPLAADTYNGLLGADRLAGTYVSLIKSNSVLDRVARQFPGRADSLAAMVDARTIRDTQLLEVGVRHSDPATARDLANGVAAAFIQQRDALQQARSEATRPGLVRRMDELAKQMERASSALDAIPVDPSPTASPGDPRRAERERLQSDLTELRFAYASVLRTYQDLQQAEVRSLNSVLVVEPAPLPTSPVSPNVLLNTLIAAAVGFGLTVAIALVGEYLDDTINNEEHLAEATELPVLAVVQEAPADAGAKPPLSNSSWPGRDGVSAPAGAEPPGPRAPDSEAFRVLRTNLLSGHDRSIRSLLITSSGPGEGKSTIAANLAIALAATGVSTLLVDADLRSPSLHSRFAVSATEGLSTLLVDPSASVEDCLSSPAVDNLRILPAGPLPPNPSELLASREMARRMEELMRFVEYVVVDSPPVLAASDAAIIAPHVDAALIVAAAEQAKRADVRRARQVLDNVGGRVVGAVLNRVRGRSGWTVYPSYATWRPHEPKMGETQIEWVMEEGPAATPSARRRNQGLS